MSRSAEHVVGAWSSQVITHDGIAEQKIGELVAKLEPIGVISLLSQAEHQSRQAGRWARSVLDTCVSGDLEGKDFQGATSAMMVNGDKPCYNEHV